ncbi:MAG: phosphotransferase [Actinomycetota bacterium]|nr:ecdysteroid 22-kinase family protein [Acidimicrobiales bacterium]MED5540665.1 phosphotransferase [Actinomycetota bacterium]
MGKIPAAFEDITADWLNEHASLGGTVASVEIERIGEGFGMISLIGRATLRYSDGTGPETVVVKLSSPVPELVALAQMYGFYEREVNFYTHAASQLPNVAECHHAEIDSSGAECALVLQDMGHLRMADQVVGCTPDDARATMDAAAALHTRFWQNDALASLTWLPAADNPQYREAEPQYQEHFPAFAEKYGDTISPGAMRVAEDLRTRIVKLQILAASEETQTLAHFDLRLDNLMFSPEQVYFLDWQLSVRAIGAVDVAYFIGWSMQNDLRRELAEELIARYHAQLLEAGVKGYSLAECEDHVRRSMLGVAMIAAYGAIAVPATNERGQQLLDAMVDRVFSAVDDLGSGEFLPD